MFEERLAVVERPAVRANVRSCGGTDASRDAGDSASGGAGTGAAKGQAVGSGIGGGIDTGSDTDADACTDTVPVPEPLAGLLPGGLHRGEVASLATRQRDRHPDYLALALLAEALNAGLWCAVVGVPDLGLTALANMLGPGLGPKSGPKSGPGLPADPAPGSATEPAARPVDSAANPATGSLPSPAAERAALRQAALDRLLLIPDPGERWAEALAMLADGVDLLLVRPLTPVSTEVADRVDARLRPSRSPASSDCVPTHAAALLVLGGWPSAQLSLRITRADWTGLDGIGPTAGAGRLTGCRATVVAQGWATAGRPRAARLWLPDANGSVRALSDDPRTGAGRSRSSTN